MKCKNYQKSSSPSALTIALSYVYDLKGNLVDDSTHVYFYDALDRLIRVKKGSQEFFYTYDSFNRRLTKTTPSETIQYFYQNNNEIGSFKKGKITELRILGIGKGAEIGAAVCVELSGKQYIPVHDIQGNIVCLYKKNSQVETIAYTAFGEELNSKTALSPWRFSSKRSDPETQFVYFGRRYYSPSHGRWMTPDPLSHESGPNLYAYVSNNPLSYFDLYGLEPQKPLENSSYNDRGRQISDRSLPPGERSVWDSVRDGAVSARDTAISGISNASQGFLDSHTRPYDTLKGQACEHDDWFSRICHSFGAGLGFGFQGVVAFETGGISVASSRLILSRYGMQRLGLPKTINAQIPYKNILSKEHLKDATGYSLPKADSTLANFLFRNWDRGTFPNRMQSIRYHHTKHGNGRSIQEYTQDAINFFHQQKHLSKEILLKNGKKGISIKTKKLSGEKQGGFWTSDEKIITYWD